MKKWIQRGIIAVLSLAALAGAALIAGTQLAERKMHRKVDVPVQAVAFRNDAHAVARGRYLFNSRGCVDCHGANGAGKTFLDDGKMRIVGPNISPGQGNVVAAYSERDWVRAIRHGVNPQGRALMVMPSEDFNRLTDDDLASLVAYIRNLEPVAGGGAVIDLPVPVRALYGFGLIQDAAAKIDHAKAPQQPVQEGVNLAHGAYVANMCLGCHGANLTGGKIPGGPPDWPAAANLTPGEGSAMVRYPDADALLDMFKTGKRPDGTPLQVMPFGSLREVNETDARALHLYLISLPPKALGS